MSPTDQLSKVILQFLGIMAMTILFIVFMWVVIIILSFA